MKIINLNEINFQGRVKTIKHKRHEGEYTAKVKTKRRQDKRLQWY